MLFCDSSVKFLFTALQFLIRFYSSGKALPGADFADTEPSRDFIVIQLFNRAQLQNFAKLCLQPGWKFQLFYMWKVHFVSGQIQYLFVLNCDFPVRFHFAKICTNLIPHDCVQPRPPAFRRNAFYFLTSQHKNRLNQVFSSLHVLYAVKGIII